MANPIRFTLNENTISELADPEGNVISDIKLTMPTGENGKTANWQNGKTELVSVYPNPARDLLNVEYFCEKQSPVRIELLTIQGVSILKVPQIVRNSGWYREKPDISGIPSGVYLLNVTIGEQVQVMKVIVNR
jgi:hypothetical protein